MANDILLDANYDMTADASGDLGVMYSDNIHIKDIIEAHPGEFRIAPLLGVGASQYVNGRTRNKKFLQSVKTNLESDNFLLQDLKYDNKNELVVNGVLRS